MNKIGMRGLLLHASVALTTVVASASASYAQSRSFMDGISFDVDEFAGTNSTLNPQECPFPDSVAVPDTLDPAGYYPLSVGDSWDYVWDLFSFPAPAFRRIAVADTLRGDITFAKVKTIDFVAVVEGGVIPVDSSFSYESVIDGILTEWQPSTDSLSSVVDFRNPFNSCDSLNSSLRVVSGGYERSALLYGPDTLRLSAEKALENCLQVCRGNSYGYSVGLIRSLPSPGASTLWLAGFTIDGKSRGAPLDTVFAKGIAQTSNDLPTTRQDRLVFYPNPLSNTGWVEIELVRAGYVRIDLIDMVGRRLSNSDAAVYLAPGKHIVPFSTRTIPAGLYLVNLMVNGQASASNSIIVLR